MQEKYMRMSIEEAKDGVITNEGGPFGAVIVRGNEIIARAHNTVVQTNDPTAHAEVNAIRIASNKLGRFDLSDCVLYTSAEPCPMCLSAIMWAGIKVVYYGCRAQDAEDIGFADKFIYDYIRGTNTGDNLEIKEFLRDECLEAFKIWENKGDKVPY